MIEPVEPGETLTHEQRSLDHFLQIYKALDPLEISRRCNLQFDSNAFNMRIMGTEYKAAFPDFSLEDLQGNIVQRGYENILFLRYLCEGKYAVSTGKQLSYREIPWGEVYFKNFEGRCLKRFAHAFSSDIEGLKKALADMGAEKLNKGDAGYRFEFCSGLYMSALIWAADDEFPPSAQMLFDDNFASAFTVEDIAVVGGVVIDRLKEMTAKHCQ
ncbi:DUF3786 domain-containing protein [Leadbettera azotonutricia]|uniref:DUF3786 domain-containing protein n=1 Tax=Leadbettera azotonutricia (strain ATCC BAA-888 / DSM 13862 / ZAS-9) TaxID=545695 RepID=F5YD85_LEAAZ|nr:DUF3786 domain-containing protein [Leadbettera azotonutricia]AEF80524.1 conserved hypothetical protein [Leadbettera azotonutricia ZAS-9]